MKVPHLEFECPHCSQPFSAPLDYANTEFRCSKCRRHFLVSTASHFVPAVEPKSLSDTVAIEIADNSKLIDYYLHLNGEQKGPFTLAQLHSMWHSGNITSQTLYWQQGFDEWLPFTTMIESLESSQAPMIKETSRRSQVGQPTPSDTIGIVIMLLPLASAALMWFWISSMNLLQSPSSTLMGIIIVTVIVTSALLAIEASQLGMGECVDGEAALAKPSKRRRHRMDPKISEASTGPVGWFVCGLLLWIIAMPAYLYTRSKYGAKNHMAGGLICGLIFLGVACTLQVLIERQKTSVQHHFDNVQTESAPLSELPSESYKSFMREAGGMVSAMELGIGYHAFHVRLIEINSAAKIALQESGDYNTRKRIESFITALLDADSLWKYQIGSGKSSLEFSYNGRHHSPVDGFSFGLSDRWYAEYSKLNSMYNLGANFSDRKNVYLHIDQAIRKIFTYAGKQFGELEKY